MTRRDFFKTVGRWGLCSLLGVLGLASLTGRRRFGGDAGEQGPDRRKSVWQIDPSRCVQCGNCESACVLTPSAVKCVHAYEICGYCQLCSGYFRPQAAELSTAAENRLCPTDAIKRTYVENPYFEYRIEEELCIGCGSCVKGCAAFGNGSLYLQIRHDRCVDCNQCSIQTACPVDAVRRVPNTAAYLSKGQT